MTATGIQKPQVTYHTTPQGRVVTIYIASDIPTEDWVAVVAESVGSNPLATHDWDYGETEEGVEFYTFTPKEGFTDALA